MRDISPSPELGAIVRRWLRAYAAGEKATVIHLLSEDPSLGYIGSSHDEIWRDDTLRRGMASYIDYIPKFSWDHDDFRGFECGSLGWVEWFGGRVSLATGKEITFRSTFVLHLEKGVWRIVHVHNSNPVSNMEALGYESRGFEDLLDVAGNGITDLGQTGIASVMFTDIADSTALAEAFGDTAWSRIVNDHLETVAELVQDTGGTLVKSLGDGTMSSYPSASAALTAAINIQRHNARIEREPHLRLRVGIHTGDVVEAGGDFLGSVVNKAARVAAIAAPGDIRISDATRIMVGGAQGFDFGDPATVQLKGLEGEHLIHRLAWQP